MVKESNKIEIKAIKLRYTELNDGLTEKEVEILLEVEGRIISLFVPLNKVDLDNGTVLLMEVERSGNSVIIELPGEPLNTGRRLEVNGSWLEGAVVA
ncbi:MAG: hypothetical protein IH955_02685 [Chloroflexi bacterium]|nr:hypothetical protein [Chloroflexota bacterium]